MRHFLRRVRERVRRVVNDLRHEPQTYDAAREELGGVAFRSFSATERWFIPASSEPSRPHRVDADSSALILPRPPIFGRHGRWLLPAVGGVVVLTLVVGASARGAAGPAAAVAAPLLVVAAPKAEPAPPPSPSTPQREPVAVAKPRPVRDAKPVRAQKGPSNMSPSVRALFEGRATGKQKRGRK
jgi:hypothetical protein